MGYNHINITFTWLHLEYVSAVWGYKDNNRCERVAQRAMRYYLGVHSKAPIVALVGDMGWRSSQYHRHLNMIHYWNRMIEMDNNRLTKQVFLYDKQMCKENWCDEIKMLCNATGHMPNFNNLLHIDIEYFNEKNHENFENRWNYGLSSKPKLRTYITFKNTINTEDYVKQCISRRKRSLLAQFRLGILPLAIETGRFKGVEARERVCKICNTDNVEDEMHMLNTCCVYNNIRSEMYNRVRQKFSNFINLDDDQKFQYLIKNEWREVSNFIDKAWEMRSQKLYVTP